MILDCYHYCYSHLLLLLLLLYLRLVRVQEDISEIVFASTESLVGAIFLDIEQGLDTSSITLGSRSRKTDRGTYLGLIIISISCQELKI